MGVVPNTVKTKPGTDASERTSSHVRLGSIKDP